MLSVLSKKTLIRYIKGRKVNTRQRRATRYLKHIDDIWQLQSAILSEADNADVEIINNRDRAETVADLLKTIMLTITASYRKSDIKALRSAHRKYLK